MGLSPAVEVAAARKGREESCGGDVRWGRVRWRHRARGCRQRRAQEPGFLSLSLLRPEASEPPGPRQKPLSGEDEPCSSPGGERGAGADPAPARCFLVEHGWTWAEPSPLARRRGPSSPRVPGAHGGAPARSLGRSHVPAGSLEPRVCLCSWRWCGKAALPRVNGNPGTKCCGRGQPEVAASWAPCPRPALGLPVPAGRRSQAWGEASSTLIHKSWGSFLVEPCSSNWKGAGNPSVWRALEPLFERSVIFQSNSLPKPPFIKYSWDPFSPGTPSPRLSPKNQSGSSACSNASCVFGSLGLPSPPPASLHLPPVPVSFQGSSVGWGCAGSGSMGKARLTEREGAGRSAGAM